MMKIGNRIQPIRSAMPMIYAYATPEIERHKGWVKIGYTEVNVEERVRQQAQQADVRTEILWKRTAIFDDGSGDFFRDTDFHAYLTKKGYERGKGEWFRISEEESKKEIADFRAKRGRMESENSPVPYLLRAEQEEAVQRAFDYRQAHQGGEFLWNAKPRFGKTLAVYELVKRLKAEKVLIATNRPAVANSWYDDYEKFLGTESGYRFVSDTDSLKGRPLVRTRKAFIDEIGASEEELNRIEFVSLQDLKGSVYFGGDYDKLEEIHKIPWDILVIDEAHEGVDTSKSDVAFDNIQRKFTLHLSGTPFKALANEKFHSDAIFNWTYADEQRAKWDWNPENGANPYEALPRLNLFTYRASETVRGELELGYDFDGESVNYAFDLNEFFSVNAKGKFEHEKWVDQFLDALTSQEKYPFSTPELRDELRHTFWLLNRVDSAKALEKRLKSHSVFKDYEIVIAAGDGKQEGEEGRPEKAFNRVKKAIRESERTITLSVGQLTTGVTIPEWSGVLMLCQVKSPALYMQTAFRAQNPWLFQKNREKNREEKNNKNKEKFFRKENAYVFDFDPARTLEIFEKFANGLSSENGNSQNREKNVRELLNFFPVISEDEDGRMIELDAEKVFSIPSRIRSAEVVRRGFMCDLLFQNIHHVFQAFSEVQQIISAITPYREKEKMGFREEPELSLDEDGNVRLAPELVLGQEKELFGEKLFLEEPYRSAPEKIGKALEESLERESASEGVSERLKKIVRNSLILPLLECAKEQYGNEMKPSDRKGLERNFTETSSRRIEKKTAEWKRKRHELTQRLQKELDSVNDDAQKEEIAQKRKRENLELDRNFQQEQAEEMRRSGNEWSKMIVETMETKKAERRKEDIEKDVRERLRGFTRTIPAFLMAYGDENVTLASFDRIIPDDVFQEVTSISLEQFRFLRDGGTYRDAETGVERTFPGRLFNESVFNDSVREFMRLRKELADYFNEKNKKNIFDYVPSQKTNQIFTPKGIAEKMVAFLEQENPGCFDDPDKKFLDPYMKSGLFIASIVKRLYQSPRLKELYPKPNERLKHIFERQVYGLAPTEIIYRISKNFLLGFDEQNHDIQHNFRCVDVVSDVQNGSLDSRLDELFGVISD